MHWGSLIVSFRVIGEKYFNYVKYFSTSKRGCVTVRKLKYTKRCTHGCRGKDLRALRTICLCALTIPCN